MNVATKEHLQNEVDPFSYLVRGRLHVLPDYGSIPAHSNSSPQGARSMGLLLEAQDPVEVCAQLCYG